LIVGVGQGRDLTKDLTKAMEDESDIVVVENEEGISYQNQSLCHSSHIPFPSQQLQSFHNTAIWP